MSNLKGVKDALNKIKQISKDVLHILFSEALIANMLKIASSKAPAQREESKGSQSGLPDIIFGNRYKLSAVLSWSSEELSSVNSQLKAQL